LRARRTTISRAVDYRSRSSSIAASTFVERLSGVADQLHVRLRLEHLHEVLEAVLVLDLDEVLRPPGRDDEYLSHSVSIRPVSASAAAR
jgi:hypothetical protein